MIVRIKKNDNYQGKRMHNVIMDLLKQSQISGATVWTGMAGYGKRGKSNFQIEGISVNMPLMIEVIDELEKLEKVLPEIKNIVGDNGLITLNEIKVV
ncbi:MAG TPA: DUF190 domain-containing protein [Verrucomicrobiae bacterium]|nr:DUF190 domain-containing protein [Verrucomicrobiae bacterium]